MRGRGKGSESVGCGGGMGICWAWERGGLVEARERQGAGEVGEIETSEHVNQLNILPRFPFMVS